MERIPWSLAILLVAGVVYAGSAHYDAHPGGGFVGTASDDLEMGTHFISFGSAPAGSGDIRLENNTTICWEAAPAGTDVCMSVDATELFNFTGPLVVDASDPGDSGAIRLDNNECIVSEASPTGTDGTVCYNASEQWAFSDRLLVSNSTATSPSIFRGSGEAGQVTIEAYGGAPTVVTAGAGGTFGSATTTASGDNIGNFVGQTYLSGTGFQTAAAFQFIATETVDASGRGSKIDWYTTPNNSTTLTKRWTFEQDGTLTGHTTGSIGWTLVSGADTACTTTCTTGCVVGQNTATFALVGCSDATADVCLCAGGS